MVDEKRRVLAALFDEAQRVETRRSKILTTIERETEHARKSGSFDVMRSLGHYVAASRDRLHKLGEEAKRIDLRIQIAQDDLRDQFTELKKIEILLARRLQEARELNERREAELMNEIGINLYTRSV